MVQRTLTTQDESPESGDGFGAPSHIIQRPRLTRILDESEARIILLCAPAGYGKTTLAREWVASLGRPVAWYQGGVAMLDAAHVAAGLARALVETGADGELVDRIDGLAAG